MPARHAVRSLSFHARYRCANTGACCTAGWPIPIEADRLAQVQLAIASGRLRPADTTVPPFVFPPDAPDDTPALVATHHDACVFFDRDRCRIHSGLGHERLPLACRQFPRISLIDPRGVSVTLSHYCPTAARLLDAGDSVVDIDANPSAFPAGAEYVGLDVRSSLPPSLRADLLMDWESWWEWERLAVARLTDRRLSIDDALDGLHAAVEYARTWSPGSGPLIEYVRRGFAVASSPRARHRRASTDSRVSEVTNAVPAAFRLDLNDVVPRPSDAVVGRFLAAHAFASWTAHLGHGLRVWLRSIEAAMALLESGAGVRHTDLLLRHLAETAALTSAWNQAEVSDGG